MLSSKGRNSRPAVNRDHDVRIEYEARFAPVRRGKLHAADGSERDACAMLPDILAEVGAWLGRELPLRAGLAGGAPGGRRGPEALAPAPASKGP